MTSIYDFDATTLDGTPQSLAAYRGRVVLVVNVASRCSFTPQYAGLETLYKRYEPQGFSILGFPCNQFMRQEPGDADEIREFCSLHYNVTFPIFAKIDVNGPAAHPLYKYLKSTRRGLLGTRAIKWNFTKFLIDRAGAVLKRYPPTARPERIEQDIARLIVAR